MVSITKYEHTEKNYDLMVRTIDLFLAEENDVIANLSNISAIINSYMEHLNWVGFYILKEDDLVLGPFQGKPACIRMKPPKGVCFSAVIHKKTVVVPNVDAFSGHIACDSDSRSELVAPIYKNGEIFGVLDLDSPLLDRFTNLEVKYIDLVADKLTTFLSAQ